MKTFEVTVERVYERTIWTTYTIETETEQEARLIALKGHGKTIIHEEDDGDYEELQEETIDSINEVEEEEDD